MSCAEDSLRQLNKLKGCSAVIVGIGNTLKGDDAAGPLICQELQQASVTAEVIDAGIVPENYIQTIIKKAPQNLIIIDAVDFAANPGTIRIFKPNQLNSLAFSTHTLSPHLFIDMITRAIGSDVYFIGIQPANLGLARPISAQVSRTVQQLARKLVDVFPPRK